MHNELNEFYNIEIPLMKQVLGEKLHYHCATGELDPADPFEQAVIDLFPYFKPGSRVLDCGCGWGGPGRILQENLHCYVTGVTISAYQTDYCRKFFNTITADLNVWKPGEHYDTALFMESYVHMTPQALLNVKDHVQSIVIKDFIYPEPFDLAEWHMHVRTPEMFELELDAAGFKIEHAYMEFNSIKNSTAYWYDQLVKLDVDQLPEHLKLLYKLCIDFKSAEMDSIDFASCTVYATKK